MSTRDSSGGATIRAIESADLERILEINAANVPEVGPVDADALARLVELSVVSLASIVDGDVAGFCLVLAPGAPYESVNYRWFMERYEHVLYLDRVAFDARHVGRGLGRALYGEVERRLAEDHPDASALGLEVNIDPPNEPSLAFHAALGFREVGRQLSHGHDVSLMLGFHRSPA